MHSPEGSQTQYLLLNSIKYHMSRIFIKETSITEHDLCLCPRIYYNILLLNKLIKINLLHIKKQIYKHVKKQIIKF